MMCAKETHLASARTLSLHGTLTSNNGGRIVEGMCPFGVPCRLQMSAKKPDSIFRPIYKGEQQQQKLYTRLSSRVTVKVDVLGVYIYIGI